MIIVEKRIKVDKVILEDCFELNGDKELFESSLFFDLEHYIYKVPICIGVFGSCYYDKNTEEVVVTQYMIQEKKDSKVVLKLAVEYFKKMKAELDKKYIVTFSGNNDYTVIKYLFHKYNIDYSIEDNFTEIDIQKEYEKLSKRCIGLKALELEFNIIRKGNQISGSNLAKTFNKIMKDDSYINRMPEEKINTILLYNQQDVVSLFNMIVNWIKIEII